MKSLLRHIAKHVIFILLLYPFCGSAQHTLTVTADGISSSEGFIAVGVYNTEDTFLKEGKIFAGSFEPTKMGKTKITIADLPEGTYAVSIFHDKNGNKALDTNFIGIPKEPVAFYKGKMKTFGPPDFEECAFVFDSDTEINIPFR
ncbi:DUF2141 domain-containing protein [Maribacter sp. 2307UL18-2]|uniref:DUF2141 domain-containing protein n=1 Tax=Maribacter sp. 2307UL18-2 TaxID=3386274 RepID=UPI0039BCF14B